MTNRIVAILLGVVLAAHAAPAAEFVVAPDGADTNPGTKARPFASIARARDAVRASGKAGREPVTVFLRGGTYYLDSTLVFTSADSGSATAPVVYAACEGETPVVSGGVRISLTWEPYRDGILKAKAPADFATDQLFINGVRQPMARYPNFDPKAKYFFGFAADAFSRKRAARWTDPAGGFIHAMHRSHWGDFHYRITGKDAKGEVLYEGGWQNNRRMGMHGQHRFVENLFEELDAPGEWFLDAGTGTLYVYPPVGVDLSKAVVEGVRLKHLVAFRGSEQTPVRFITLRGLTFRHAARTFMENREPLLRSDWTTYRGGAVVFDGAEDCTVRDGFVDTVGGNGIFVNTYNRRITITGCRILNAGASSISFVGDPKAVRNPRFEYHERQALADIDRTPGPKTNNYPADCLVHDNLLVRNGRVEKQTAGVNLSMAARITIRHNSIYDCPRAGINICDGTWGGHVIEYNDVFDTVKETGDHGSFNSWGRDRFWHLTDLADDELGTGRLADLPKWDAVETTVIRNNRWRCDHGWDIDLDDGSTNYHIVNNLCLNGGIKNREGFYRVVENNIMVNNGFHPHVWYANSGDVFRRNIVCRAYRPARMSKTRAWGREMDENLLHSAEKTGPAVELQKASRRDEHSVYGDARFVAPGVGDYRVQDGSPARGLGFLNFPMDRFGVVSPALRAIARTPVLPAAPGKAARGKPASGRRYAWFGADVRTLAGQGDLSATGLAKEKGVLIVHLPGNAPAAVMGFREGDVILSVGGKATDTAGDLLRVLKQPPKTKGVDVAVWRDQKTIRMAVRAP